MITLTEHQKKVLRRIGNNPYGKELVDIMIAVKAQVLSLDGIDESRDVPAQVAGRLLFKTFAESFIEQLSFERKAGGRPTDIDEFA